jgi:predicted enzyme related to lactoylglutathione lyase
MPKKKMPFPVAHFAINCSDVERARVFYDKVFGWKSTPWGPPGFYQMETGGIQGALQQRREIVKGKAMFGAEISVGVEDIDATSAAVLRNGGKIVMPKVTIPTVGTLIFFEDPEGNIAGAMQYDSNAQ